MRRRPPRGLSAEERALWQKVAESATPMPQRPKKSEPVPPQKPKKAPPARPPIQGFAVGEKARPTPPRHDLLPGLPERLIQAPVQMDRKNFDRMKRGKLSPEARIDLHGMTLAEAHPALINFVSRAHGSGKRLLLVITGKGRESDDFAPMPVRRGVLRHQVPHWLNTPPLGPLVLQIVPAHQKHGGGGAYYVYLRR